MTFETFRPSARSPRAFPCTTCGARVGEPCRTVRESFSGPATPRYRGKGQPTVGYSHAPRLRLYLAATKAFRA